MKNFSSIKVAITGLLIILVIWVGWKGYASVRLSSFELTLIPPGEVNLVAISPEAGYKIIVANEIAYLAEVDENTDTGAMEAGSDSIASAPRLPLRELLQTLQGDEEALGALIERLNDWDETDVSTDVPVWRAEDIQLALDGDQELQSKLTADLNVDFDGLPLDTINIKAIRSGILIDNPVELTIQVGEKPVTMTARIQEAYRPIFCRRVEDRLKEEFDWTDEIVTGYYLEEAKPIIDAKSGEDIRRSLTTRTDRDRIQSMTERPLKVLKHTTILLNEDFINSASSSQYDASKGNSFSNVSLGLTNEGRMRLWKYSHDNPNFQLLFINDTIAIAAPVIGTELAERTVVIRSIPNEHLVDEVVTTLNRKIQEQK